MNEKPLGLVFDAALSNVVNGRVLAWEDLSEETRIGIEIGVQAAIAEHESRKWQPIDSAPLLQDVLTATNGKDVCVAKKSFYTYNPDNLFFVSAAGLKIFPTHWQPLPVPQKQ